MTVYALITARCGSKRIPKKNIRPFLDMGPIISIPIRSLLESQRVSQVIVDTDCDEVAQVARNSGALVPWLRDKELADDHATTLEVVQGFLARSFFEASDVIMVVYPTSTLSTDFYDRALHTFGSDRGHKMLVSACALGVAFDRQFRVDPVNNKINLRKPQAASQRSQDLEMAYKDAGKFYIATVEHWEKLSGSVFEDATAYLLEAIHGIDIDTEEEWKMAEAVYRGYNAS